MPSTREICKDSLGDYYLHVNPDYKYVPYQQEVIVPALEQLERGDFDRLMMFMPSRHAKSDLGTKAFIPWFLCRNPRKNVILLSHTQPLANDFGAAIRDTMTKNDQHRQVFPEVKVDNSSHAKDFFKTNRGNSFYAFGINAGVPGRGGDLVVMDDPIAGIEQALSEQTQHLLYETYKGVVKQRLQAGGKICLFMTRWGIRDIAARILDDEASTWKVIAIPAQPPDPAMCDGCKLGIDPHQCTAPYLWEEHLGRQRYEEAKKDAYQWDAMWQQNPTPRLTQGFQESWLRFYVAKTDKQGNSLGRNTEYREDGTVLSQPVDFRMFQKWNTYLFVDPAMGKEAAHDRTCMLVLAAGPEHRFFLIDGELDRLDPGERIDRVVRLARDWKVKQVVYEEYAMTSDSYFLKLKLDAEGMSELNVVSVGRKAIKGMNGGRLKKHERIQQLIPDFRDGRIWLPKRMLRTCADGSQIDMIDYFLRREYLGWAGEGSVAHDDMLDCLSRIRDPEFYPSFVERESDDENYDNYAEPGGTSWQARY